MPLFAPYENPGGKSTAFSPKKYPLFPAREPPLFFGRNAPPALPDIPDNLRFSRFFTITGRPLKAPVFSRLKRPVSKNNDFKQKSRRGLAPFPRELPGARILPRTPPSEKRSWETVGPATPPFIKGDLTGGDLHGCRACGFMESSGSHRSI